MCVVYLKISEEQPPIVSSCPVWLTSTMSVNCEQFSERQLSSQPHRINNNMPVLWRLSYLLKYMELFSESQSWVHTTVHLEKLSGRNVSNWFLF